MHKLLSLLLLLSVSTVKSPQAQTLIFSGDLRGEIKPCGCAEEGDMGGLLRRASFLKKLPGIDSLLNFDLGNNFPKPSDQGNLKVVLIQQSLKLMRPVAVLPGPAEWNYGSGFIDRDLPYLLSNAAESLPYRKNFDTKLEGRSISIMGYLSPDLIYRNPNDSPKVFPISKGLLKEWEQLLRAENAELKLLLFRGSAVELEDFQRSGLFDLIVAGSNNDDELKQTMVMQTSRGKVPMIPTKGQGVLAGRWNESGEIKALGETETPGGLGVSWLRRDINDDAGMLPLFEDYDARVKELFFTNLDRMEAQHRDSPFVGQATCGACHVEAAKIWKESRHSHAFETLRKVSKHFDPECLECHVVGLKPWEPPEGKDESLQKWADLRGFLSPELTPHLMNVQCENCHGPSRAHISNPTVKPPEANPIDGCVECHHGSHSPLFNNQTYWPMIEHR